MGQKTDMLIGAVGLFLMVVGFYAVVHGTVWAVRKWAAPPPSKQVTCVVESIQGTKWVLDCRGGS